MELEMRLIELCVVDLLEGQHPSKSSQFPTNRQAAGKSRCPGKTCANFATRSGKSKPQVASLVHTILLLQV